MRKLIGFTLVVALVVCTASLVAAFPQVLNYQGILRDAGGVAVADGTHSVKFQFYDASTNGNILWTETQTITTKAGLFNVLLGSITPVPETVFDNDAWLGITVETDPEMTPRTQIGSVGYAYHALNSDKLQGLGPTELVYPSTPARVFRVLATGSGQLFGPAGRVRQITGIWLSAGSGGAKVTIGGVDAIWMGTPPAGGISWSSGNGAPMQVEANESVEVTFYSGGYMTITGFEF